MDKAFKSRVKIIVAVLPRLNVTCPASLIASDVLRNGFKIVLVTFKVGPYGDVTLFHGAFQCTHINVI